MVAREVGCVRSQDGFVPARSMEIILVVLVAIVKASRVKPDR